MAKKTEQPHQILTFSKYQDVVQKTDETKKILISLLGLVGEVGDLHSKIKKLMIQKDNPTFKNELTEEFGDILWYLTSLAALYKISLADIAQSNIHKAESLFLEGERTAFDQDYPADERFPRQFKVLFIEKPVERGVHVKISVNDVVIGDALTDNANEDDGYRYHDVFHLAYTAVLGWSPVTRAILRRKRKSSAKTDEVEDGARAILVEEAISLIVFNQAKERGWYEERSSIDIGLLKTLRRITAGLEVTHCSAKQWKSAIFQGYKAFSLLRTQQGGTVEVNLDEQSIVYVEPITTSAQ